MESNKKGAEKMVNITILQDEDFLPAAKALVFNAMSSIYISTFKTEIVLKRRGEKLKGFYDFLVLRRKEGVDVRLLTNKQGEQGHVPHTNAYVTNYLKKKGIQVRFLRNSQICHAKMLIVDNQYAIIGSHNLSLKSCHSNFEVSYLIKSAEMVSELANVFIETWYNGKDA